MKIIGIARVSTEDQAGDNGQGLDRQRHSIEAIAKANNATLIRIVEIVDVSGSQVAQSAEWRDQVMPAIMDPDTHIAIDALDRLIRASDFGAFQVLAACQTTGTRVYMPGKFTDFARPDDVLMTTIMAGLGGREKSEIRRRMTLGKEAKRRAGRWVSNPDAVPLGFSYDKKSGVWSLTHDIARVQRAYADLANGTPIASVAKTMGMADGNTRRVLRNPIYKGLLIWDKKVGDPIKASVNGKQTIKRLVDRDPSDVITVRILAEADQPIADGLWHEVQARLEAIKGRRLGRKTTAQGVCWATGFLVDAADMFDGNTLNTHPARLFGHLHDVAHWRYHTPGKSWSYAADRLHFALDGYMAELTDRDAFIGRVEAAARKAQAKTDQVDRDGIESQIATLRKAQIKMNQKFDVDAIDLATLKSGTARIKTDIAALEAKLSTPSVPSASPADVVAAAARMALWPVDGTAAEKRSWLERYQAVIYLTAEAIVTIRVRIPSTPVPFMFTEARKPQAVEHLLAGFRPGRLAGVWTTTEVAAMLGLSPSNMRKLILKGRIPAPPSVVGGDGRRWHQSDIDAAKASRAK